MKTLFKVCDHCKKHRRKLVIFNGSFYCRACLPLVSTKIPYIHSPLNLEEALDRTYNIREVINREGIPHGICTFPRILIGKKIKVIIQGVEK